MQAIAKKLFETNGVPDKFARMVEEFLQNNESYSEFVQRIWKTAQEDCQKDHLIDIKNYQDALCRASEEIADLHKKNHNLADVVRNWQISRNFWHKVSNQTEVRVRELQKHLEEQQGKYECVKDINEQLAERVEKQEKELEDLGKTLRYREDLNIGLANKLKKAYQERNKLQELLDKQEYVRESADALERMINHHQKRSISSFSF